MRLIKNPKPNELVLVTKWCSGGRKLTKLEEMLADYFVEAGKMKSVKYDRGHIEVEYEDENTREEGFPIVYGG